MNQKLFHPALNQLLRFQSAARFKKIVNTFRSPRRQVISLLALVLGFVWLGQAISGILLREAADPSRLAVWIPLSFLGYSAWHLIKTISCKPIDPFDWTPAETELLGGAPFSRLQMILYRLVTIIGSAILKSTCFSFVMIPDLQYLAAGFFGMLLGLLTVDVARVLIEMGCFGLNNRGLVTIRVFVYSAIVAWIGNAFWVCFQHSNATAELASPGAYLFAKRLGEVLIDQVNSSGTWLMLPFKPAVDLILTQTCDVAVIAKFILGALIVGFGVTLIVQLDRLVLSIRNHREARSLTTCENSSSTANALWKQVRTPAKIRIPLRLNGIGSIAWRQFLGAYHYRMMLFVSLGVPTGLCCLPLLAADSQIRLLTNLVAGLVFYSFLLLPSALMLDFRRDVDRLVVLKSLPISPLAVTLGQLAAPVFLCLMFQWTVLMLAMVLGSITVWQTIIAGTILIPVCVLIFAMENLIFMIAPYRRNEEGLFVFLRTILTFTAKGILFALAFAGVIAWGFACQAIGSCFSNADIVQRTVFGLGICGFLFLLAIGSTLLLAKTYRDFDPSQDAPAIS